MGCVVAIAGTAGAGKSTLVRGLVSALGDALAVHIDDYQRITQQPLRSIVQWMNRGADFDEFVIPLLGDHLERLKRGETVVNPVTLAPIAPRRYIVFETHFGRAHDATGRWIDVLVWIDTPLDVALARNLQDLLRPALHDPLPDSAPAHVARLDRYLQGYLTDVRPLILMQQQRIGAGAEIRVDGSDKPDRIVAEVQRQLLVRCG